MLPDMKQDAILQKIKQREERIAAIKARLMNLGALHPGSLSKQYNVCGKPGCRCKDPRHPRRHGPYYQLNYVFRGRKTSRFVPCQKVAQLRQELASYKALRRSIEQWTALALQIAQAKRKMKPRLPG
jgi:hypothetical protein